jgi:integrase
MSKSKGALTDAQVEKFKGGAVFESGKSKGEQKPQDSLWCSKEGGFGIRMGMKTGVKTFILQYRIAGSLTDKIISIGRFGEPLWVDEVADGKKTGKKVIEALGVDCARARALELKATMRLGIDPVEQEKQDHEEAARQTEVQKARETTLRQVMESYLANRTLRDSTANDYRYHVKMNFPEWADEPVKDITRDMCLAKFTEITERGAPIQANLAMVYLRALLNHARVMHEDKVTGNPTILAANPVTRMIKLKGGKLNPEKPDDGRIALDKIGKVWLVLRERANNPRTATAADWLSLMLLTGMRRGESRTLRWADVDLDHKLIHIPGERTKNHDPLILPMSETLHEILSNRKPVKDSEYVFVSKTKTHIKYPGEALEAVRAVAGPVKLHDFRRTFDDVAMECKIDGDVRRKLINHKTTDVHGRHYANASGKALQAAVDTIAAWVQQQAKIAAAGNVVSLQAAAQRAAG